MITVPNVEISGLRGQWVANVSGEELAVLHETSLTNMRYSHSLEPSDTGKKMERLRNALLQTDRAVIQREDKEGNRTGYAGVFRFENLNITDAIIELDIVERVANPKK